MQADAGPGIDGLLTEAHLRFPWRNPRVYRKIDGGFVLLRPFE